MYIYIFAYYHLKLNVKYRYHCATWSNHRIMKRYVRGWWGNGIRWRTHQPTWSCATYRGASGQYHTCSLMKTCEYSILKFRISLIKNEFSFLIKHFYNFWCETSFLMACEKGRKCVTGNVKRVLCLFDRTERAIW